MMCSPMSPPHNQRSRRNSQVSLKFPNAAPQTIGTVTAVVTKDASGRTIRYVGRVAVATVELVAHVC